jgi:hypothetical protein
LAISDGVLVLLGHGLVFLLPNNFAVRQIDTRHNLFRVAPPMNKRAPSGNDRRGVALTNLDAPRSPQRLRPGSGRVLRRHRSIARRPTPLRPFLRPHPTAAVTKTKKKLKILALFMGCTSLVREKIMPQKAQNAQRSAQSDDVGEAFAGAREPPVSEEEDYQGEEGEVGETAPVWGGAAEEDATVAADYEVKGFRLMNVRKRSGTIASG